MIYATPADLESYLGTEAYERLCDRDDSGAVDVADVEENLANASSLADSYIAKWIPELIAAAATPHALKQHVMNLAVYLIAGDNATEDMRKRYEDALKWLLQVSRGDASLGIPPVDEDGDTGGVARVVSNPRRLARANTAGLL
jgi:phage gp36-like protein